MKPEHATEQDINIMKTVIRDLTENYPYGLLNLEESYLP